MTGRTVTGLIRFDWPGQAVLMPLPVGSRLAGYSETDLLAEALPDDPAQGDDELVELPEQIGG